MSKERKSMGYWQNPENINRAYDELKEMLGRVPTSIEFRERFSGAANAMFRKRYNQKVKTWNQYLTHRGEKLSRIDWSPEKIDEVFDEMKEKLGRVPIAREFEKEYSGALGAIKSGRYSPEIKKWNQYVLHRREKPNNNNWTPELVDEVYDKLKKELGRTPAYEEFHKKYSGALRVIEEGRCYPNIRTWNQYLIHRKEKPNKLGILENLLEDEE